MKNRKQNFVVLAAIQLSLAAVALSVAACSARDEVPSAAESVAATSEAVTTDGTLRSLPSFGDKCVSTDGYTFANGTGLILWDCVGQDNQKWSYTPDQEIRGFGGKCLAAGDIRADGGIDVFLAECDKSIGQRWFWGSIGRLGNERHGYEYALSTYGYQHLNGTKLVLWQVPPTGPQANQLWSIPECAPAVAGWCHRGQVCRRLQTGTTERSYACVCPPEISACDAAAAW